MKYSLQISRKSIFFWFSTFLNNHWLIIYFTNKPFFCKSKMLIFKCFRKSCQSKLLRKPTQKFTSLTAKYQMFRKIIIRSRLFLVSFFKRVKSFHTIKHVCNIAKFHLSDNLKVGFKQITFCFLYTLAPNPWIYNFFFFSGTKFNGHTSVNQPNPFWRTKFDAFVYCTSNVWRSLLFCSMIKNSEVIILRQYRFLIGEIFDIGLRQSSSQRISVRSVFFCILFNFNFAQNRYWLYAT